MRAYAVLGPDGTVEHLTDDYQDALRMAYSESTEVTNLAYPVEEGEAFRANLGPSLSAPERALQRLGTAVPVVTAAMLNSMTVEQAWERLYPYLPPGWWRTRESRRPGVRRPRILNDNTKLAKGVLEAFAAGGLTVPPTVVEGLTLAPTTRAWEYGVDPQGNPIDLGEKAAQGRSLCLFASKECQNACLVTTGQQMVSQRSNWANIPWESEELGSNRIPQDEKLRGYQYYNFGVKVRRTHAFLNEPVAFMIVFIDVLRRRLEHYAKKQPGTRLFVRMNILSDVPWELFCPTLFDLFPDTQFYDYTKVPGRGIVGDPLPDNYHLTFSYSGHNAVDCQEALEAGRNVTVVMLSPRHALGSHGTLYTSREFGPMVEAYVDMKHAAGDTDYTPVYVQANMFGYTGLPVFSGDISDARPYDPLCFEAAGVESGVGVISLRYKLPKKLKSADQGSVLPETVRRFVVSGEWDEAQQLLLMAQTPAAIARDNSET